MPGHLARDARAALARALGHDKNLYAFKTAPLSCP
jgi:hypothetical protein